MKKLFKNGIGAVIFLSLGCTKQTLTNPKMENVQSHENIELSQPVTILGNIMEVV